MGDLTFEPRVDGPVGCLALSGEVRVELIPTLHGAARQALGGGARHLLVDVSRLGFVDSASLGALLQLSRERAAAGGRMVLVAPSRAVDRVLDACGMRAQFAIAASESAARALLPD
jgi:anti-anti-sigma factor